MTDNNNSNNARTPAKTALPVPDLDDVLALFDEPVSDADNNNTNRAAAHRDIFTKDLVPIVDRRFTPGELALAELAKYFGGAAVEAYVKQIRGDPKTYMELLTRSILMARKLPKIEVTAGQLDLVKDYPHSDINVAAKTYQWVRHLVTPMNLMSKFMDLTIQKLSLDEGVDKWFTVGTSTVKITFNNEAAFYDQLKPIFKKAEEIMTRTTYEVAPYSTRTIMLTLLLGSRVSLKEGETKWTYVPSPPADPSCVSVTPRLENICNVVAQVLANELAITHWYQDLTHPLDMLYVCLSNHKLEGKSLQVVNKYFEEMESAKNNFGKFAEVPSPEEKEKCFQKYGSDDILLAQAKQMLNDTKDFMADHIAVGEWMEDITTPNRVANFKTKYWGLLSKVLIMQEALKYFGDKRPEQMYFHGIGSDKLAQGIERGQALGFFKNINWPGTPTWIAGTKGLRSVDNTIGGKPPVKLVPGSIVHMFSMPAKLTREELYDKHLYDTYDLMEWDVKTPSVMTAQHGLSGNTVFSSVVKFAKAKNLHMQFFRHHRYHNDAIQWIFTNAQPYERSTVRELTMDRIVMEYQVYHNNIWRNNMILTGRYLIPPAQDQAIFPAMGVAYAIQQYNKELKKSATVGEAHDDNFLNEELGLTGAVVTGRAHAYNPLNLGGITAAQFRGETGPQKTLTIPRDNNNEEPEAITAEDQEALQRLGNFGSNIRTPTVTPPRTPSPKQTTLPPTLDRSIKSFPVVIQNLIDQAGIETPPIMQYLESPISWDQRKINELKLTLLTTIDANKMESEKAKRTRSGRNASGKNKNG